MSELINQCVSGLGGLVLLGLREIVLLTCEILKIVTFVTIYR